MPRTLRQLLFPDVTYVTSIPAFKQAKNKVDDMSSTNPFLHEFTTPDHTVPFASIKVEHFIPALEAAIQEAKTNIENIKKNPAYPTFENTILALETCAEKVDNVRTVFSNLEVADVTPELQALSKEFYPLLSSFGSDISLDPVIFKRVQTVYENRSNAKLLPEQNRLLEKTYLDFVRNGAVLSETDKERIRAIDQELSVLGPQFSENVLKATNKFELVIDKKSDLEGLPEGAVEAASMAAAAKGYTGRWLFNLQAPSFVPFMTYAKNRSLREKMWRAYNSRSFRDEFDNQENVKRIVQLRHDRAYLLGYKTHADYVLAERMAKDTGTVNKFLKTLLNASKKAAQKDLDEVVKFGRDQDAVMDFKPWDFGYYSEKLKEKKYAFNEEDLRPYFKLENVIEGVFEHARRLYGLTFKETKDVQVYNPEVKVYEIRDRSDQYIGLFYTDFFPRATKKGGAWMTSFRDQGWMYGAVQRPHISIVCNFTQPTPSKPSLLSYDEVKTLFHEFGHALHGMLSTCTYRSIAGTNVYWDFVELPSQIMENWVGEKEGLDIFAKHYQTGESIPAELVDKLKASEKFLAGWSSLRQLTFALMDMTWHSSNPSQIKDVDKFEDLATSETRLLERIPGTNSSCSFSHIFAGGYSAGYYSYKWAEVLDADAFEYFKEKGLFNPEVAESFRRNILSRGGTEHPMELYKKFRGREPDPNALLRRDGLI
jgi:peptidyl-dipeptidase Dcp